MLETAIQKSQLISKHSITDHRTEKGASLLEMCFETLYLPSIGGAVLIFAVNRKVNTMTLQYSQSDDWVYLLLLPLTFRTGREGKIACPLGESRAMSGSSHAHSRSGRLVVRPPLRAHGRVKSLAERPLPHQDSFQPSEKLP